MTALRVQQLTKEYPTRGEPLRVLRGVEFSAGGGESVSIVGPSGCGKSTLLHILGTLDRPTSGSLTLDDRDPFALNERELAQFRNRHVGFVFQDHHLLPQLTAWENVVIPALATGATEQRWNQRARDLLEQVGLGDRLGHRPAELSGGERQRVAIARALLFEPRLLLADEPTGNLDPQTAAAVAEVLWSLTKNAAADSILILVTHSLELAARADRCFHMQQGKLQIA